MIDVIQHLVRAADSVIARAYLALFKERNAVLSFLFHALFRDESEISRNMIDPLERTTVAKFRELCAYYVEHGYRFISPDDLLAGLDPAGRYALLTFDDGYHNNTLALPVLKEFNIPATFYIATENILQNRCYWWDVLYRERLAQGANPQDVYHEGVAMKSMRTDEIEAELIRRFGPDAFKPRSDIDRPFTPLELREFAQQPQVHLGNHTANHAILTNYDDEAARRQISDAQNSLEAMAGVRASSIAYPNGAHSDQVVRIAGELGLKVGFTIRPVKQRLPVPMESAARMTIGRFCPHDDSSMASQCRTYRSDVLLYATFRAAYLRLLRKQPHPDTL
jgi:peptidoglycan/xylan/chitin deacetylase (PgdA/CDA1 family)